MSKKNKQTGQRDGARAAGRTTALCAAVIIIAALAAYWNSFDGVFVYDDSQSIRNNVHIRKLWPPSEPLSLALWSTGFTVDARPVLSLSFAMNHALFGPEPWGYHLVNLAIHVAAALLLFGIIRRTLRLSSFPEMVRAGAVPFALAAALLWLVHPLQTGSVTYIVQRAESLMGMFYLLTLYCAIRVFEGERARRWGVAAVVACALGMGTKEVMASAPVVVLLYDYVFVSGSLRSAFRRRRGLYLALGATWAVLAALLFSTLGNVLTIPQATGPLEYALTQPGVILYYLRLVVWPWPLVMDYNWPFARDAAAIVLPGIAVVALLGAAAWGLWRRRWWGFLGAWFFLILVPSSSFYPLRQNLFEHRMYLPLAAAVVLAVAGAAYLLRRYLSASRSGVVWVSAVAGLAAAGTLSYGTIERNRDYHSEAALWQANVAARDESFMAHLNLANALSREGKVDQAIRHYRIALETSPEPDGVRHNLGIALIQKGQALRDRLGMGNRARALLMEAIGEFKQVLVLTPDFAGAHTSWGSALLVLGQVDEAISHFRKELEMDPGFFLAHYYLAMVMERRRNPDEAIKHYELAAKQEPTFVKVLVELGRLLKERGNSKRAVVHLEKAVALQPANIDARLLLSEALADQGDPARALAELEKVVELAPNHLGAANNLAWLLATCPTDDIRNGKRAVALAKRVCAATGDRDPLLLDTLAAAHAEAGDFPKARQIARQALKLAELRRPDAAAAIRERLALYEAGKAYRDRH